MKKVALFAAGAASLAIASPVQAAAILTSASILGVASGNVYNTALDGNWAVFLQRPIGVLLNPNDDFSGSETTEGMNNFLIAGEGDYLSSENSDLLYRLTLTFADGAVITGDYLFSPATPGGQFVNGTSATVGNSTYTMNGFGWDRSRADNVSAFQAVSGGNPFDYTGQFSYFAITAPTAVPEPATWAMFILGFGALGFGLRRRNAQVTASKAKLNFA